MKPRKKGAYSPKKKLFIMNPQDWVKNKPHCVSQVCEEFWSNV